jgi:hypothetical protein
MVHEPCISPPQKSRYQEVSTWEIGFRKKILIEVHVKSTQCLPETNK